MIVAFGIVSLLIGLKFGDWRNYKKYYPTILFLIIGDLLYNILTYHDPAWRYTKTWLLQNHTLVNLWIMITVYPSTVIIYLFYFPKKKMKQVFYILLWVMIYILLEIIGLHVFGLINHFNGWNMWWSLLFDVILFVILPIHQRNPLVAWGLSLIVIIFFLTTFDVKILNLH
ncbi:CBO0543 family protein [Bacillus sp. FJAT-47783]|uniref:CBO0543 family protein n=1 Tax=Bacillus sp. FJAT-47783 TaxID=2922712 RepID=UPI001FAE1055|nr:CBO0543 family protein [Bacillus sp. FJAT-47783]